MVKITLEELDALAKLIHQESGNLLDRSKSYLLESRLSDLVTEFECSSYRDFYLKVLADRSGALKEKLIDAITTKETSFFRDKFPFDLVRFKFLPDQIDRVSAAGSGAVRRIRVWSAACSTGQEVYSLAVVLREMLLDLSRWEIKILGTDISASAVEQARSGRYSQLEVSRGFPPEKLDRCFERTGQDFQVRPELRALTEFRQFNLLQPYFGLGRFDLIFCRNVGIYFSPELRQDMFNRLADSLLPGGYLVIGSTESLHGISTRYERKEYQHTVCYRLPASSA